jgi:hypothetical protein
VVYTNVVCEIFSCIFVQNPPRTYTRKSFAIGAFASFWLPLLQFGAFVPICVFVLVSILNAYKHQFAASFYSWTGNSNVRVEQATFVVEVFLYKSKLREAERRNKTHS